jgi:hypothetical protein
VLHAVTVRPAGAGIPRGRALMIEHTQLAAIVLASARG